jgi:hypothetical protein
MFRENFIKRNQKNGINILKYRTTPVSQNEYFDIICSNDDTICVTNNIDKWYIISSNNENIVQDDGVFYLVHEHFYKIEDIKNTICPVEIDKIIRYLKLKTYTGIYKYQTYDDLPTTEEEIMKSLHEFIDDPADCSFIKENLTGILKIL